MYILHTSDVSQSRGAETQTTCDDAHPSESGPRPLFGAPWRACACTRGDLVITAGKQSSVILWIS